MAKDYHIKGFSTPEMIKVAKHYRDILGIGDAEYVDILSIIEFELVKHFPDFRLEIVRDKDIQDDAYADPANHRITVKESIYKSAYEGDPRSRMILAHELGHYLLHKDKGVVMHKSSDGSYESIKNLKSDESTEDQADMFARHFMIRIKTAYELRNDLFTLSKRTGVPPDIAKGSITISKRQGTIRYRDD